MKWKCQSCKNEFDIKDLTDIWFVTNANISGRLHGICSNCNTDENIEKTIDYYIKILYKINNYIIIKTEKKPFLEKNKK